MPSDDRHELTDAEKLDAAQRQFMPDAELRAQFTSAFAYSWFVDKGLAGERQLRTRHWIRRTIEYGWRRDRVEAGLQELRTVAAALPPLPKRR